MKAILHTRYGSPDLLEFKEVEKPAPKENQVLIKVRAASINAIEYRTMRAKPFFIRLMGGGFQRPKDPRFGTDVAGQVEALLRNMPWRKNRIWHSSQPIDPSKKSRLCLWRRSPLCRVSAMLRESELDKRF